MNYSTGRNLHINDKTNFVACFRQRQIPAERPLFVGEVRSKVCG
jgi:hypothetical protein